MRKTPLVLALVLPPAMLVFAAYAATPKSQKAAAATPPVAAAQDDPARDNTGFMHFTLTENRNPAGLDFVVTTDLWQGPKMLDLPGGNSAFLKVQVFPAAGPGEPVAWFKSEPFSVTQGVRTGTRYPFQIPLPPDPRGYLVVIDIISVDPVVSNRAGIVTSGQTSRHTKRVRLQVQ